MPLDRSEILSRIRKLRAMTTSAGCTEAEASVAASKLASMIAEYSVSETELGLKQSAHEMLQDAYCVFSPRYGDWDRCLPAIGRLFSTRPWLSKRSEDVLGLGFEQDVIYAKFFGYPQDVAASIAMCEIIYNAMNSAAPSAKRAGIKGAKALASFRIGMAIRFNERLADLRPKPTASTGTSLIVVKDALVREEFAKLGINLGQKASSSPLDPHAFALGKNAANRVDLGSTKVGSSTRALSFRG